MKGIIQEDKTVLGDDGIIYELPIRLDGVLVEARNIGLESCWRRQSIQPLIGKRVKFSTFKENGYNYEVIED